MATALAGPERAETVTHATAGTGLGDLTVAGRAASGPCSTWSSGRRAARPGSCDSYLLPWAPS
jgi:hypothetical protein